MSSKAVSTVNNNNNNNNNSSPSSNANTINAKYLQNKYRINKANNSDEKNDALMFETLLRDDKGQHQVVINAIQEQQKNSQQFTQDKDEEKKDNLRIDGLKDIENKNVFELGKAEKTHTTEFCNALSDNHNKHNFEVTLPKLGTFKIQTNSSGNQLKFDVSTGQKDAFEWVRKNQSSIEENVGKDLNLAVTLGIEYAV